MRSLCFIGVVIVGISIAPQARGEWVGFEFDGLAIPTGAPAPYGFSQPSFNPVSGHFYFDTDVPAEPVAGCPTCAIYRQEYPSGFTATFNALEVSANEYEVVISDNFAGSDSIQIRWLSNLANPLAPLTVQGIPQMSGVFRVNLQGGSTIFADASLPTTLDLAAFPSRFSFLTDAPPPATIDVPFNVTALRAVKVPLLSTPEPGGFMLAGYGFLWFLAIVSRRRQSRFAHLDVR